MDKSRGGIQPGYIDFPDHVVEQFIAEHGGGASIDEIAQAMGVSRQLVDRLCRKALAKCQVAALRAGINADDFPSRESVWDAL